ncbi:hypothetical protein COCCADRAFT_22408 [Bipolaris zeicola 26-R-13]|uniref:Uncharacterized protein n=1 Tax=Cochliobolus carbonum (strain 26-R-13) TaxID=930089 RepID=W6Z2Z7_COCC2|nr:uncharacterized protein COCCADRAFT_22408 [Bipolaris zeicola 26-R-13]EUC38056.1 hypothetical protein COCCADRAFT_22408 [Bipolaris zeicola 26-R-13]
MPWRQRRSDAFYGYTPEPIGHHHHTGRYCHSHQIRRAAAIRQVQRPICPMAVVVAGPRAAEATPMRPFACVRPTANSGAPPGQSLVSHRPPVGRRYLQQPSKR